MCIGEGGQFTIHTELWCVIMRTWGVKSIQLTQHNNSSSNNVCIPSSNWIRKKQIDINKNKELTSLSMSHLGGEEWGLSDDGCVGR